MSTKAAAPSPALLPPHGLNEIVATFGDIFAYVRDDHTLDPRWETEFLDRIALPFPMALSWDKTRTVREIRCHKLATAVFSEVFEKIYQAGVQSRLTSFGGCFSFRPQRTGTKLSAHSWGIAIDLNPETNAQGTAGNMDSDVIDVFRNAGFEWGGTWKGRALDPMHFQFCSGY